VHAAFFLCFLSFFFVWDVFQFSPIFVFFVTFFFVSSSKKNKCACNERTNERKKRKKRKKERPIKRMIVSGRAIAPEPIQDILASLEMTNETKKRLDGLQGWAKDLKVRRRRRRRFFLSIFSF
jgi:hypothetical protein